MFTSMTGSLIYINDIAVEAFAILHEVWHVNAPENKNHIDNAGPGGGIQQLEANCHVEKTPNF